MREVERQDVPRRVARQQRRPATVGMNDRPHQREHHAPMLHGEPRRPSRVGVPSKVRAGVLHGDHGVAVLAARADPDLPPVRHRFDGALDRVHEGADQDEGSLDEDRLARGIEADLDLHPTPPGQILQARLRDAQRSTHDVVHVQRHRLRLGVAVRLPQIREGVRDLGHHGRHQVGPIALSRVARRLASLDQRGKGLPEALLDRHRKRSSQAPEHLLEQRPAIAGQHLEGDPLQPLLLRLERQGRLHGLDAQRGDLSSPAKRFQLPVGQANSPPPGRDRPRRSTARLA